MESPVAKDLLELGQDLLAALPRRGRLEHARTIAADEPHDDPGLPVRRGDVEARADRPLVAQELTGEAVLAPERLVVEDLRLDQGAHRHPLGQLVAVLRQERVVPDPPRQGRRHGHDHALAVEDEPVGVHVDPAVRLHDAARWTVQEDAPVAQALRQPDRHQLGPAEHAPLLPPAARVEVALEGAWVLLVARGGDVEERE